MEEKIALQYIDAINAGDTMQLYDLMTEDHLFIDSHDNHVTGRNDMIESWKGYFTMFPDYKIEVNEIVTKGPLICILGYAGGTYKNLKNPENSNYWRVPATWTAIIINGHVKQWQVYADNTFSIDIINRNENFSWLAENKG